MLKRGEVRKKERRGAKNGGEGYRGVGGEREVDPETVKKGGFFLFEQESK